MFELRPPKELSDLHSSNGPSNDRKQSRVFVDNDNSDDSDDSDDDEHESRRRQQHDGGEFGDGDASAEDVEDYGEAAEFGDNESDGDEVQNVGVGLGFEGRDL